MFVFVTCWTETLSHFQESDSKNDICLWFGIWNFALALLVTANICELLCALKNQPPPRAVPTVLGRAGPPAGPQGKFSNRRRLGQDPGLPREPLETFVTTARCPLRVWQCPGSHCHPLICPGKENKMLWAPQVKTTLCTRVHVRRHLVPSPILAQGLRDKGAQPLGAAFYRQEHRLCPWWRTVPSAQTLGGTERLGRNLSPARLVPARDSGAGACVGGEPRPASVLQRAVVCVHR